MFQPMLELSSVRKEDKQQTLVSLSSLCHIMTGFVLICACFSVGLAVSAYSSIFPLAFVVCAFDYL